MNRKKIRKLYEQKVGPIPDGYEIHHIVPVYEGGTHEISNLVAVSPEKHKELHYQRYLKNGDVRDLMASKIGLSESDIQREKCKLGGKRGAETQIKNKIGIHGQTKEERLLFASMGGKKGAFTQSEWQSEFGKRGGVKNKGFVWLTDGENNIKYTRKQQEQVSTEEYLKQNPSYRMGRTEPQKICNVCGKKGNARAIGRYHNKRCKYGKD